MFRWRQNKDVLEQSPSKVKSVQVEGYSHHPAVDNRLFEWVIKQITDEELVTRQHLATMALFYAEETHDLSFQEKSWEAVLSWVTRFMKRYRLVYRRVTSSKGGIPMLAHSEQVKQFTCQLKQKLKEQNLQPLQILNMDETGIWFEEEPKYTITFEGAQHARVSCSNATKTRATVVLCCTASGHKTKPAIIFKGVFLFFFFFFSFSFFFFVVVAGLFCFLFFFTFIFDAYPFYPSVCFLFFFSFLFFFFSFSFFLFFFFLNEK